MKTIYSFVYFNTKRTINNILVYANHLSYLCLFDTAMYTTYLHALLFSTRRTPQSKSQRHSTKIYPKQTPYSLQNIYIPVYIFQTVLNPKQCSRKFNPKGVVVYISNVWVMMMAPLT